MLFRAAMEGMTPEGVEIMEMVCEMCRKYRRTDDPEEQRQRCCQCEAKGTVRAGLLAERSRGIMAGVGIVGHILDPEEEQDDNLESKI